MTRAGFSLLEVVVALAILAMSLIAIFSLNSGAISSHVYTKRLTVASLLARSKMTDLEQELYDKGFNADDEDKAGDFSDEGWPKMKWRAKIIAPKTQGLSPQQLVGAIFGIPLGGGEGGDALGPLSALFGGGKDGKGAPPGTAGAGAGAAGALSAMGPMAGLMQGQFTQMIDQLTKAVREVHLTVTWSEGKAAESIDLVTHVVSLGPGSDRNGGAAAANPALAQATQLVNPNTCAPVASPTQGPNGQTDPADNSTLIPLAACQAAHGGAGAPPSLVRPPFGNPFGRGLNTSFPVPRPLGRP